MRAPPGSRPSADFPELTSPQLNRRTKLAADWCQVLELVTVYGDGFDEIHAATALHRLSSLQPPGLQQLLRHPAWTLLLGLLEAQVHQLNGHGFASVLLALGRLRQAPRPLLVKLLPAVQAAVPDFVPQQLSNALTGLANMGLQPGQGFLLTAEQRLLQVLPEANPQNLSNSVWAFAKLKYRPADKLLVLLSQRLADIIQTATSQAVANLLWAYRQFGFDPGSAFMALALSVQHKQVRCYCSCQSLAAAASLTAGGHAGLVLAVAGPDFTGRHRAVI